MDLCEPYINYRHLGLQDQAHSNRDDDDDLIQGSRRRRKVQHKKVMCVPITGDLGNKDKGQTPPTDFWTWRKYGQKPIKGSPYPRGYYRCSSSKGCTARKQVERSWEDPAMVIITYTADHNHVDAMTGSSSNKPSNSASSEDHIHVAHKEGSQVEDSSDHEGSTLSLLSSLDQLLHQPDFFLPPTPTTKFSPIVDSPCSSNYAFDEEEPLLEPSPWVSLERAEQSGQFGYVNFQGDDAKEDAHLPTRYDGEDFFSELGMLPELASIFNQSGYNDKT